MSPALFAYPQSSCFPIGYRLAGSIGKFFCELHAISGIITSISKLICFIFLIMNDQRPVHAADAAIASLMSYTLLCRVLYSLSCFLKSIFWCKIRSTYSLVFDVL